MFYLILILGSIFLTVVSTKNYNRVHLGDVQVLTFKRDEYTKGRRLSPILQLECVGGSAATKYEKVETVQCRNVGFDGNDYDWECKSQLPENIVLGKTIVTCEGWDNADDPYVLAGSCGLEYELNYADNPNYKKMLFEDLHVLTFTKGEMTVGRRTSPMPQLQHAGGTAVFYGTANDIVKSVQCTYEGQNEFRCVANTPANYKLGKTEVTCEGWDNPDDKYILANSCSLRYNLDAVTKVPVTPAPKPKPEPKGEWTRFIIYGLLYLPLFFLAFFCILGIPFWPNRRQQQTVYVGGASGASILTSASSSSSSSVPNYHAPTVPTATATMSTTTMTATMGTTPSMPSVYYVDQVNPPYMTTIPVPRAPVTMPVATVATVAAVTAVQQKQTQMQSTTQTVVAATATTTTANPNIMTDCNPSYQGTVFVEAQQQQQQVPIITHVQNPVNVQNVQSVQNVQTVQTVNQNQNVVINNIVVNEGTKSSSSSEEKEKEKDKEEEKKKKEEKIPVKESVSYATTKRR